MAFENNDTIVAISTPLGAGGIGIVRVSGPDSKRIAEAVFRPSCQKSACKKKSGSKEKRPAFTPRKLYHGHVAVPGKEDLLDEVLIAFMPAPKSYTMEDVIEIQAHGGSIVLKEILELIVAQGARLAEAGEFTKRAYLNGRIDLSQAEAVIDIIQAKTNKSLAVASKHLEGTVGRSIKKIKRRLLEAHALLEAGIEFPEELDGDVGEGEQCVHLLKEVDQTLEKIMEGYQRGRVLRDGLRLTILGKVNVGKSSLLNRLLKKDRAIVTEYPGTTRDHIEEMLDLYGLPVVLTDTAGWRDTKDPVEKIGIDRTKELVETADLVLLMVDAEKGVSPDDHMIYEMILGKEKILVVNKTDLLDNNEKINIPEKWEFYSVHYTSVKFGQGVDGLKQKIHCYGTEGWLAQESGIVPNLRQYKLFKRACHATNEAMRGGEGGTTPELTVIEIREAIDALDEITGVSVKSDVLDTVFSRFCIGK